MRNILGSASKIVFLAITATLCLTFTFEIFVGKVTLEAKDFMLLAGMAFSFYFASKPTDPATGQITK